MLSEKQLWDLMAYEAEKYGLNLEDILASSGIPRSTWKRWELGAAYPSGVAFRQLRTTLFEKRVGRKSSRAPSQI